MGSLIVVLTAALVGAMLTRGGNTPSETTASHIETTGSTDGAHTTAGAPTSSKVQKAPAVGPAQGGQTLVELDRAGDVDGVSVEAVFGTRTIAGQLFEAVSTEVYRDDRFGTGSPWIKVATKRRYTRVRGVVGIREDAECSTPASVMITGAGGRTLWGPERVTISTAEEFDVPITGFARIDLVSRSLAESDDACGGGLAEPAWGDVEFLK